MKALKMLAFINILIIMSGCDKNEENTFLKGSIVGFVNLVDDSGNVPDNSSGVNVSIEGIAKSVKTNEIGRFELTNVPAGSYNILYAKDGYGTQKIFSFQFIGGNIPALLKETILYKQPNIDIQNIDISLKDNIINISGEIPQTSKYKVQTFLKNSSDVSNLDYDLSWTFIVSIMPVTHFAQSLILNNTTYLPGDKLYLVTYFVNPEENFATYDYEKEKYYFTSARKASDVMSLIYE